MQNVKNVVNCISSPFSAAISFQKQFVDDVIVNVKKRSEEMSRHNQELQNRRVRLHLDHLEEEYLCCVCGKPGEERDTDDMVSDEFSIVHMPSKERIEQVVIASGQMNESSMAANDSVPRARGSHVSALLAGVPVSGEQSAHAMLAKVQHFVLNQEAVKKQKRRSAHRDKGLMKIEESDIDIFQQFFRRPVHGYLCSDCYTSAKKRLDALTTQIQTILFKGKTPFLHTGRGPAQTHRQDTTALPSSHPAEDSEWGACGREKDPNFVSLSDAVIMRLRGNFRCAVCKRRQASFFVRQSATFLCQFCCARDRFYRENVTCINDELMPRETAHLLESLAFCEEKSNGTEEHSTMSCSRAKCHVDLFREHNAVDLFATQSREHAAISVRPALPHTPSPLDRRSVAGNISVSLFSGKKIMLNIPPI